MPAPTAYENGCSFLDNGIDIETLKKQLPHVDLKTGLTHRVVKRDPISGLGVSCKEDLEARRPRTASTGRSGYNKTLIYWDADTESVPASNNCKRKVIRNPITLTGDFGAEVDLLNNTSRPRRTGTPREPQRDPIAGRGSFGDREWDPIGKYNGRSRRAKSTNGLQRNPLTGDNVKAFLVNVEEKTDYNSRQRKEQSRNIFTGENCKDYEVSPELKSRINRPQEKKHNILTGENCESYDFNSEVRKIKSRAPTTISNPLSGENMKTFIVSKEEKQRTCKPYVYRNTVTGENLASYKITPIERNVTPRALKERQNPLNGENIKTFTYHVGESNLKVKKRDISSPLTGDGSRGRSYTISIEEKTTNNGTNNRARARSYGPTRNVLTGENCESFGVCKEMRSERAPSQSHTNGAGAKPGVYNIITGGIS